MKIIHVVLMLSILTLSGCNVSPFSPQNRPNIRQHGGEIGDIKNNQNGVMAEVLSLKNRLDVLAKDVDNLQNGFINNNNKNFGIQIFQGESGLAAGVFILLTLGILVINYKLKSDRYKKTAEIFAAQIKKLDDQNINDQIFRTALANKVEKDVYKILTS